MYRQFLITLAALALSAPAAMAEFILPAERVVIYPPSGELRMVSGLPMGAEAQNAFDSEFRSNTYFSAFALSKGGGWGYATTTNSLGAARAIAMAECLNSNTDCLIIAEIVPRGYRELQPGDVSLTPEVVALFNNPESVGATNTGARAMAVSADGAYALVWGYGSQAEANAAALSDCSQHLNQDLPGVPDMPCTLVPGLPGGG